MLHSCMHSGFLINIENTESTYGEVLLDHNAASTISNKTENMSTPPPPRLLCFHAYVSQVST